MAGQRRGSNPSQELLEGEQGLAPDASSGDDRRARASSGDTRRKPATSSGDDR